MHKRKTILLVLPALLTCLVSFSLPRFAEAQYRGYHGRGYGYGYRRPPLHFKHRFHLYAGVQGMGFIVLDQATDYGTGYLTHGGGGGIFGGVRLGPWLAIELNWNITYHNVEETWFYDEFGYGNEWSAFHLQTLTIDGKIHIPTRSPFEPYFQAGIGFGFLGVSYGDYDYDEDYIFSSGPAFNLGGGADFWVSPFISVGFRLLYRGIYLGEPGYRGTRDKYGNYVSGVSVDGNLTLHF